MALPTAATVLPSQVLLCPGSTVTIISQGSKNAAWNTEYQSPTPQTHLGDELTLGVYNNEPIAVFAGTYPASGAYSPNEDIVEKVDTFPRGRKPMCRFLTMRVFSISAPLKSETISKSWEQLTADLATSGRRGRVAMASRAWASQSYGFPQDAAGNLTNVGGSTAFFSSIAPSHSYYNTITGGTLQTTEVKLQGNSAFAVGSDLQVINGVPTLAFLDRTDGELHLDQLINGTFTDQSLASGNASWPQAVSVFHGPDGNVAVAAIIQDPQGGNSQVEYFSMACLPNLVQFRSRRCGVLQLVLRRLPRRRTKADV